MWEIFYNGIVLNKNPLSCIIFSKNVINKLKKMQQNNKYSCEHGGLLLGYIRGDHFDVRNITVPYKHDLSTKTSFIRKDERHIRKMEKLRKQTNGEIVYIGEWHTHSERMPNPSRIDIAEWEMIKLERNYPIVFLIIGTEGFYIECK